MIKIRTKSGLVKIYAKTFEYEAFEQVKKLANYSAYSDSTIRIMPDAHAGKGCTVGTTMTLHGKVTPNLVGVDIGCSILCIKLKNKEIDFEKLDNVIRENVPSGFGVNSRAKVTFDYDDLRCGKHIDLSRANVSLGSLGGGNHFIEVDYYKEDGCYYLVIHSGSRNLGVQVCKYYQNLAYESMNTRAGMIKKVIADLKAEGREKEIESAIKSLEKPSVDKELAHLEGAYFDDYIHDMEIVQNYARVNRSVIASSIMSKMGWMAEDRFETIHNYIDTKRMILRKGAVSAERGERLIIPMNMRDGSLICIGKGNADWNYSAPHGAGRLMSRSKAKEMLSMDDFKFTMEGIYTTSVCEGTLDESPMAYKPMEEIMEAVKDTVFIEKIIIPVYNFKAN